MSRNRNVFALLTVVVSLAEARVGSAQKKPVTQPLVVNAVAGQGVAIVPVNMLIIEPEVPPGTFTLAKPALVRWVDSVLFDGATSRAPEVKWIPPQELRRISKRAGGLMPDPDQMGQSIMRSWGISSVPDPLRSNLRRLLAVAGGSRYAMIPASVMFRSDSAGVLSVDMSILLADVRTGRVVWRSVAKGSGGTPQQVLAKAVVTIFPVEGEP
jgi:hypothetical protein